MAAGHDKDVNALINRRLLRRLSPAVIWLGTAGQNAAERKRHGLDHPDSRRDLHWTWD